jgi:hypothetical protein
MLVPTKVGTVGRDRKKITGAVTASVKTELHHQAVESD